MLGVPQSKNSAQDPLSWSIKETPCLEALKGRGDVAEYFNTHGLDNDELAPHEGRSFDVRYTFLKNSFDARIVDIGIVHLREHFLDGPLLKCIIPNFFYLFGEAGGRGTVRFPDPYSTFLPVIPVLNDCFR